MEYSIEPKIDAPVNKRRSSEWIIGIFMVIGSGVLAYLAIILPLQAASRHEENVSISLKGMVFVPTLLGVGLILIFKGNKPSEFLGTRESFASSWQAPAFCCMSGLKAGFALMDMNFNART